VVARTSGDTKATMHALADLMLADLTAEVLDAVMSVS
jgi:hypothetical protein